MVESIISDLSKDHEDEFHVVRLNGFIHTDDKLALKEIWRQLGREMEVEDDLVAKVHASCQVAPHFEPWANMEPCSQATMLILLPPSWRFSLIPLKYQGRQTA